MTLRALQVREHQYQWHSSWEGVLYEGTRGMVQVKTWHVIIVWDGLRELLGSYLRWSLTLAATMLSTYVYVWP